MAPVRADQAQKMRKICYVLRLHLERDKDRAYEEIQDEIVLLLERAGKAFSFE